MAGPDKGQAGFTLLELLVAFSIMALSMGMIYKSMGSSVRNVSDISLQQQASMLTASLLTTRDSVTDQGWNESGQSAVFSWQVTSTLYQSPINSPEAVPMHQIRVAVTWPDGSRLRQMEALTLLPQRKPLPGERIQ